MEKRPPANIKYTVKREVERPVEITGRRSALRMQKMTSIVASDTTPKSLLTSDIRSRLALRNGVVGSIAIWPEHLPGFGPIVRAEYVGVDRAYHGQGIGTGLYEAASRVACRKYGAPLASAGTRTKFSSGFWKKQVRKGRAQKVRLPKTLSNPSGVVYTLSCPAPASLGGRSVVR